MKRIYGKSPIDSTAYKVTSKGIQYEPVKDIRTADSSLPIATRRVLQGKNLIGRKVGRLSCVGLARDTPNRWVMRCLCGTFTLRTAKAINNIENTQDRCERCRHYAYLRRNEIFRRTGERVDIREL